MNLTSDLEGQGHILFPVVDWKRQNQLHMTNSFRDIMILVQLHSDLEFWPWRLHYVSVVWLCGGCMSKLTPYDPMINGLQDVTI